MTAPDGTLREVRLRWNPNTDWGKDGVQKVRSLADEVAHADVHGPPSTAASRVAVDYVDPDDPAAENYRHSRNRGRWGVVSILNSSNAQATVTGSVTVEWLTADGRTGSVTRSVSTTFSPGARPGCYGQE